MFQHPELGVHDMLIRRWSNSLVADVGQHAPGLGTISEVYEEDLAHRVSRVIVLNRKDLLHSTIQVASHQIGASNKHLLMPSIAEVVDACVLQEAPDNWGHRDVLADSRNPGP
jgi:hypothetical protein